MEEEDFEGQSETEHAPIVMCQRCISAICLCGAWGDVNRT